MLFSQQDVADYLNANFECTWEKVRDVPRVHVDFGGGVELERTILGNIATYFCFDDGTVYDVLPGLVDADEYLRRARKAVALKAELAPAEDRYVALAAYHEPKPSFVSTIRVDVSKSRVEAPLKSATGGLHIPHVDPSVSQVVGQQRAQPLSSASTLSVSKGIVESPIKHHIVPHGKSALEIDTERNRTYRYPMARRILYLRGRMATPDELKWSIFRDVLEVPLEDPFLGLAPRALGGEGGRILPIDRLREMRADPRQHRLR